VANTRTIEVFSAGCPACDDAVQLVERLACPSCEVEVLEMNDAAVARRAKDLGIRSVPAVVVDGAVASCCRGGPSEEDLRAAGIGQPLS
jgi:glutaredoxin 3